MKLFAPILFVVVTVLFSCNQPHDAQQTLEHIKENKKLRAGIAYHPPFVIVNGEDTSGIEISLLRKLADTLGVQLQLVYGSTAGIVQGVAEGRLDIAAAGFTDKTLFKKEMGLTNWYLKQQDSSFVFGITKGENAWVMYLEQFIYAQRPQIANTHSTAQMINHEN